MSKSIAEGKLCYVRDSIKIIIIDMVVTNMVN